MSSITNVNQNSSVVNVGRTTPVTPGPQTASKSIPVVMASDQTSIPVEEQNKVQSEVALSLLGIPRAEIALGIFADVNTYDVNPSEWSMKPEYHIAGGVDRQAIGIKHLPTEAGALVEASRNKVAVLTSKRFFRYQPGRVSAATFGVKSTVSGFDFCQNPPIRKFGIYDNYDGYYWENRNNGKGDNFSCVRRTQSLNYGPVSPFGIAGTTLKRGEGSTGNTVDTTQLDDYRIVGLGAEEGVYAKKGEYVSDRKILQDARYDIINSIMQTAETAWSDPADSDSFTLTPSGATVTGSDLGAAKTSFYNSFAYMFNAAVGWAGSATAIITAESLREKCKRDLDYWIDMFLYDLKCDGTAHTVWNTTNFALPTANGTSEAAWNSPRISVGVFPQVSLFEAPIHAALYDLINANSASGALGAELSTAGKAKLLALATITANAFGNAKDLDGNGVNNNFVVPDISATADYGNKSILDTIFETKRNFWSYYVTAKKDTQSVGSGVSALTAGKKYVITDLGTDMTWTDVDANSTGLTNANYFIGKVFEATNTQPSSTSVGKVAESITYTAPQYGPSGFTDGGTDTTQTALQPFRDLTQEQLQQLLRDKCQRDVGYILDGYKNDVIGGGDAETAYNMQMFLRGTGLSVYSQEEADGTLSEPTRHQHLKSVLELDFQAIDGTLGVSQDLSDKRTQLSALASRVVANFDEEDGKSITEGDRGFPGNLVVMRDGLLHTHAGIYDPSLLKDAKKIKSVIEDKGVQSEVTGDKVPTKIKLTDQYVTFAQHVRITWSGSATSIDIQSSSANVGQVKLDKGEIVLVKQVIGPKGNIFTATKAGNNTAEHRMPITLQNSSSQYVINGVADTAGTAVGTLYVETVVPFVFPLDYDILRHNTASSPGIDTTLLSEIDIHPDSLNNQANDRDDESTQRRFRYIDLSNVDGGTGATPKGAMFPYMYAFGDDLRADGGLGEAYVGFVNTALDPNGNAGDNVNTIRSQIDNVNFFPEYVNWIKNNVKPEFWGVYEYRVPRSRFSHDALDGVSSEALARNSYSSDSLSRSRVYSDIATSPVDGTVARPGQIYSEAVGEDSRQSSLYNYDFTKVTMLKIEFSWYGAVGALFLAYVPVGNGEARWVRVHHLRASNQLKIASLGNATLPITYTTYGGGDSQSLGDGEETANDGIGYDKGYTSSSHHIVKYGASYYIDGGDRGTVRLYSHNNDNPVTCRGKQFAITGIAQDRTNSQDIGGSAPNEGSNTFYINTDPNSGIDEAFYMGATVKTASALDQNIKVVWVDASGNKLYLSGQLDSTSSIKILPDRAETVYGIETKKVIKSTKEGNLVRNRVQVYPTKMSTANLGGTDSGGNAADGTVRLRFKKTPIFQTSVTPGASGFALTDNYTVTSENAPLPTSSSAYLQNGESTYGWFRGRIGTEGITVFGRLYKETDQFYFELLESFEGELTLFSGGTFLADKKFQANGTTVAYSNTTSKASYEKEGLSSVLIATDVVVPIPDTGINVATTYLQHGTEQFDLAPYFDYNKEYLSYPLTDIADSLYLSVDRDVDSGTTNDISLGVTWEEQ